MKIIAITGMPGAGKTTVAQIMKNIGFQVYSMGDVVRSEVEKMGLEIKPETVGKIANEMREKYGPDIWAKKTIAVIRKSQEKDLFIIEGCRSKFEAETFKKEFGQDFIILSLNSSQEKRFERLSSRGRRDDIKTFEEFKERDNRELSWGLGNIISIADYKIINEGTFSDLRKDVEKLVEEVLSG